MSKLSLSKFQVKMEIVEVNLKILSDEEKKNIILRFCITRKINLEVDEDNNTYIVYIKS